MRFVVLALTATVLGACSGGSESAEADESRSAAAAPSTASATPSPSAPATASASAAPAPPPAAEPFPVQFQALGTEPFWSLAVDNRAATFSTPEDISGQTAAIIRAEAGGVLTVTGSLGAEPMRLTVSRGQCSDGMSDTVYPFTARLAVGSRALEGCARPGLPRRSAG